MDIFSIIDTPQYYMYYKLGRDMFLYNLRSTTTFNFEEKNEMREDNAANSVTYNLFYDGKWKLHTAYVIRKSGTWPCITLYERIIFLFYYKSY